MKIYTKTGDAGETSLIGGKRVPKYHNRIEAYGTVDELLSFVGLLRDSEVEQHTAEKLLLIQEQLMVVSALLASDCDDEAVKIPQIKNEDILFLEKEIDAMDETLEPLSSFIIPGGHKIVSLCHVVRTVCRRSERLIIKLADETFVPQEVIMYMNRLSDYFFVLSRFLSAHLQVVEHPWLPKL